jgi:hypothetical protein
MMSESSSPRALLSLSALLAPPHLRTLWGFASRIFLVKCFDHCDAYKLSSFQSQLLASLHDQPSSGGAKGEAWIERLRLRLLSVVCCCCSGAALVFVQLASLFVFKLCLISLCAIELRE